MTEEELDNVELKLKAFTEFGDDADLTDWERGFMADQCARFEQYGERVRFSDKQMAIIDRVYGKLPL